MEQFTIFIFLILGSVGALICALIIAGILSVPVQALIKWDKARRRL